MITANVRPLSGQTHLLSLAFWSCVALIGHTIKTHSGLDSSDHLSCEQINHLDNSLGFLLAVNRLLPVSSMMKCLCLRPTVPFLREPIRRAPAPLISSRI
ncbi:hypothetical protein NPIL_200831 [Nephila pilipes]|uniref:Uncharacterized protein n=1 Tax=Nephila pilipes TaxID=299642 RepID=A0A8X6NHA9_NEPPI|nr:hypothetical protein NPIL_200831 [Nephila pilipes]